MSGKKLSASSAFKRATAKTSVIASLTAANLDQVKLNILNPLISCLFCEIWYMVCDGVRDSATRKTCDSKESQNN